MAAPETASTLPNDPLADVAQAEAADGSAITGQGPWRIARRRLLRNKAALAALAVFVIIVALALGAPLWAHHVAHTGPTSTHLTETVKVGGKTKDVVTPEGVPLAPTYSGRFFFGADSTGKDVAVRLLYGARNSLLIGVSAALITALLSLVLSVLSGYFRGLVDGVISRAMDVIWAYPAILLGVALGTSLALGGLAIGPLHIAGNSKLIPIFVIAIVYVPYMGRPLRGQVLALRQKEFVEAAEAQGASPLRIMFSEIVPNLSSTVIVFLPLMIANAILLEAALSFVGAGVQRPEPSWGTMISEGVDKIITGPHLTIVPGLMLLFTVVALNVFGDGVRDALDPRAKIRVER